MVSGEQYQSFDDQHDRMTGLISVVDDAEKKAKNVHQKMQEIAVEIDTMSYAVLKLKGFAGEGIRNVTNDGKLSTFEDFCFKESNGNIATDF